MRNVRAAAILAALFLIVTAPTVLAAAPKVSEAFPAYARPGVPATFQDLTTDPDNDLVSREWDMEGDAVVDYLNPASPFTHTYPAQGVYTGTHTATDAAANTASRSFTVIVDGTSPTTTLTAPAPPSSGWYSGAVSIAVSRSDTGGSGLATTVVSVDGTSTVFGAGNDVTITVSGDGAHTVDAFSRDRAGNVETTVSRAINIDGSAPAVKVTSPGPLGAAPGPAVHGGVAVSGDVVSFTVDASDAHSSITSVQFFVGGALVATDTDGSDGYSTTWDSAGRNLGSYEFRATGRNGANLATTSAVALLLVPDQDTSASAGASLAAYNDCATPIGAACVGGDSVELDAPEGGEPTFVDPVNAFGVTQAASAASGFLADGAENGDVAASAHASAGGVGCSQSVSASAGPSGCVGLPGTLSVTVFGANDCATLLGTACTGGDTLTVSLSWIDATVTDPAAPFGMTQGASAFLGFLADGAEGGEGGVRIAADGCSAQTGGGPGVPGIAPSSSGCGLP